MERVKVVFCLSSLILILLGIDQRSLSAGSTFDQDEWTPWSHQTPCSRSCDGGITQQFRRCKSRSGCHGVSVRRKMCNMQPCLDRKNYRREQCKAFDGIKYRGAPRTWEEVEDPQNPCANTCRAEGTDIIAKLSARVKDGTRCKTGGLHVCVDGICEAVGCDLKLGSPKKVDECGICGGDGKTCTTAVYRWALEPLDSCSAPCGGGQEKVSVICRNGLTNEEVEEFLCNSAQKPYRTWQSCNIHPCEPTWEVGEWSSCSASCGGGLRIRRVYCAQEKNSSKIQVAEKLCSQIRKPANQEACNSDLCPHWHVGPWSACSATCGEGGLKTRNVVCRDYNNLPSSTCDPRLQPPETRACEEMPPCPPSTQSPSPEPTEGEEYQSKSSMGTSEFSTQGGVTETLVDLDLDYFEGEELPREHTLPLIQPYGGLGMDKNGVLYDQNAIPSEPTFVAEAWGPCSASCGEGVRKRQVTCKIFLEFTRTVASLPDKECFGPKPPATESCFSLPCPPTSGSGSKGENFADSHHAALADSDSNTYRKTVGFGLPPGISIQDMSFSWKVDGYTPCSASCLGGVQERRIVCVRDYDQRAATPVLCMDKPRPDIPTTRTCNDHPCPPRWNVTEFGPCSKSCGGGVMTREVSCIHEVTRGNTVTVPNTQCPNPNPRTEMLCNAINCPPYWEPEEFGKCSKSCGGGVRTRRLHCKQVIALGQVVERVPPELHCTQPPPPVTRPCNKKQCGSSKGTKDWKPNMTLKVKGEAKIYNGVTLKLRCPTNSEMDPMKIVWMKDHNYVQLDRKKVEILPKGTSLKIKNTTFSDSGIYTCLYQDRPVSNISLMIQPLARHADSPTAQVSGDQGWNGSGGSNSVGGRDAAHSTLYADQQPGVSIVPTYARDSANVLTPNTRLFAESSASSLKPSFSHFLTGILSALWPFPRWTPSIEDVLRKNGEHEQLSTKTCTDSSSNKYSKRHLRHPYRSSCGFYYWETTQWSNCSESTCFTWNTGIRSRNVECRWRGKADREASDEDCVNLAKPKSSEECYNKNCKGVWKFSAWTECQASCDGEGVRTRVLRCVWYGTDDQPAGNACQSLPRPPVIQPCIGSPCSKNNLIIGAKSSCRDLNSNCPAVKALGLCHLKQFHGVCCDSCPELTQQSHNFEKQSKLFHDMD